MSVAYIGRQHTHLRVAFGESVDNAHQPTPASLRARIAEMRVKQKDVARRLGIPEVRLSHVLVERRGADDGELAAIAAAVEAEITQAATT